MCAFTSAGSVRRLLLGIAMPNRRQTARYSRLIHAPPGSSARPSPIMSPSWTSCRWRWSLSDIVEPVEECLQAAAACTLQRHIIHGAEPEHARAGVTEPAVLD